MLLLITYFNLRQLSTINLRELPAAHPGDCSVWISYDADKTAPRNWIKIKDYPGCLGSDGNSKQSFSVDVPIPKDIPNCEHCVFRWEWHAVHFHHDGIVEFYGMLILFQQVRLL